MITFPYAWFARISLLGAAALTVVLLSVATAQTASSQPGQVEERKALRVCQDPSNMPFSNISGQGIENKIAELFASKLGLPVVYYSVAQRMNFIRNSLRFKLPGEDYRCDIVIGVPAEFDQVSTTKAYYRSTYALVYIKGKGLDDVKSGGDFLNLSASRKAKLRVGLFDRSPASQWLSMHGMEDIAKVYRMMDANPEQYPGEIIEKELQEGRIDAAIVWGPIAGYYANKIGRDKVEVIALKSQPPRVRFDFEMAMGVRYGEPQWKAQIEKLIAENKPAIDSILRDFSVPLVAEGGELLVTDLKR
jgi:quinoprotein dehydrogenase-associated probable ABC transporter substrate-binding protein